ncbi:MAG: cytochrome C [Desulfuromonadales bacterium]|nr:cytochrome C [Desulfuromonadales bacterium]
MFRTLVGRALVPVGLTVTGFMVVCCLLLYSAIRNGIRHDAVLHATNLSDTILKSMRYSMLKSDRETLATIITNIGQQNGVSHVRVFNKKGIVSFSAKPDEINRQVDKTAEGCIACHRGPVATTTLGPMNQARTFRNAIGTSVMAITMPVYNEPECFNASCHVHQPGQKVLGTLDVGLSQESLISSLAVIRTQMVIFTIMTLLLTLGGVTALLRRSVFLPLQRLRDFAEAAAKKGSSASPPSHLPDDLNRIASCIHSLAANTSGTNRERDADDSDA